ncbi:aminotransferase class V-fold PLP-dependent enzyme [Enterobacteriaceae endosymbiont of Plateumaris consimilis]|uniref:aminotransferase class V-fold PLP-dependent enzyme n=1 Tax=Enterobacteriaceae endosymbiont of Plateumaris consimilis TaxID=2675794 RepID=UPI0014492264|nr:aminotransferase class V-fold PLP-dependent enzyme [Enterobacteriaceae endosymbiont of Plateumaris consimilis]QJC28752.1 aminotransferase class V-fold PLP-dependent enzyme [Enterobacteriaceae endosymbiont of Plateumaris consimilis]
MKNPIYLDYASTTPVDKRVLKKMIKYLTIDGIFGNPSSNLHIFGWNAEKEVDIARKNIAKCIGCNDNEIIFTSTASESINIAIKSIINCFKKNKKHIITTTIEHKSVIETCLYLEKLGFYVTYLKPSKNGLINLNKLQETINAKTILVSIMHVNNEIGVIQNISKIGKICHNKNIIYHVDATQSIGKYPFNLKNMNIDLMSFSAHKFYGPKGVGVLYINKKKPNILLDTFIHGGGQEQNIRSGTLAVHQIIGMSEALLISINEMEKDRLKIQNLKNYLWNNIKNIKGIFYNGDYLHSSPYIINIGIKDIFNKLLIIEMKNIAVSLSSACTSYYSQSSYVLKSIGLTNKLIKNSIRISLGRFTTKKEIDYTIYKLHKTINKILHNKNNFFIN